MSLTEICGVDPRSPARRAGIRPGETLLRINGHPVADVLDYKFYSYDPRLELKLRGPDGRERTVRVRKQEGEDLGLEFPTYLMDKARSCANRCIFCFVDQMPPGMRKSLYFKDDDARLSFLLGNYLTLTNLSRREMERIMALRISPINISVHTTDPALRVEMLKNPRAGEVLEVMKAFARRRITMNCQIVACPGINDGPALERTLEDLAGLYPAVNSVSVVPVGLTKYREGLYPLEGYRKDTAREVLDQVEDFARRHLRRKGTRLVWCSDEFYLLAEREMPEEAYFESFTQLDNGVGMLRLLSGEFRRALELMEPEETGQAVPFTIATGVSAAPFLEALVEEAHARFPAIRGSVRGIRNLFFGESITVAGLVTGRDLLEQLKGQDLGERVLIPATMLRSGESVFLDDVTLEEAEGTLGVPVVPVAQDGFALLDAICGLAAPAPAGPAPGEGEEFYRYHPGTR